MTRTEQILLTRRAGIYLSVAEHCTYTSFATLVIGVPLTLAAFAGLRRTKKLEPSPIED